MDRKWVNHVPLEARMVSGHFQNKKQNTAKQKCNLDRQFGYHHQEAGAFSI
jgi:hypothetical protein